MFAKKRKVFFICVLVGIVLFFTVTKRSIYFPHRIINSTASYLIYPVLVMQHKIVTPVKQWFEKKRTIHELNVCIALLRAERENLLAKNIELSAMLAYRNDIQELLDFKQQYDEKFSCLTQILVKNFSEQAHFFLVDGGSKKGIKIDMVAVFKNCLLGRVIEVYPLYSKVILITDKTCKVASYCKQTNANGIHHGNNQLDYMTVDHVTHLSSIKEGDCIFSSGEGLVFPRGFALGRVISSKCDGLFYRVKTVPFIDIRSLQYCYIIQKGAKDCFISSS